MITSGGLSGGLSSAIAGGSFSDGFRQGIIVSGLNHSLHMAFEGIPDAKTTTKDDRERYKDTRKAFNKFVRQGKYQEAVGLIVNVFKLDEDVKGHYDPNFEFTREPAPEGYSDRFMVTSGEAFAIQKIQINIPAFQETFGTFIREVHHEFVHVFQKSILGFVGATDALDVEFHYIREYTAYGDSLYNKRLPGTASYDAINSWKKSREDYWKWMSPASKVFILLHSLP